MPLLHAFFLILAVGLTVVLTGRWKVQTLTALLFVTGLFALTLGDEPHWFAKEFGTGFAQTLITPGLVILAGAMIAALAEGSGAQAWLRTRAPRRLWPVLAVGAGIGGTPVTAATVILPILHAMTGSGKKVVLGAGALISASQASLIPAPIPIAAMAILGADWRLVLAYGVPVTLVQALIALWMGRFGPDAELAQSSGSPNRRAAIGLIVLSVVVVALLILASLGQMPSEPLGSGSLREKILGSGRPLLIWLAGVGIMLAAVGRFGPDVIGETGWLGQATAKAAPLILLVGTAGGLQMVILGSGNVELLCEHLSLLPWAVPIGVVLPFAIAALAKALHGSALTAAITAAGMMQPLLAPLGLDDGSGRALAALAVGVGALSVPHINDGLFWVVGQQAGLTPGGTLKRFTAPIVVQGLGAVALLLILANVR